MAGFFNVLLDLILTPGSSLKLIPVINISILALILLLFLLSWSKIASIHLIILGSLALGLLLSVNWFYHEYKKALKNENPSSNDQKTD